MIYLETCQSGARMAADLSFGDLQSILANNRLLLRSNVQINFYSVILQFRVLLHVTTHGLREISRTSVTPTFNFLGETFTTNKIN